MNKRFLSLLIGSAMAVLATAAQSATIQAGTVNATTPSQVTVSIDALDFPETVGGGLNISWNTPDSILTLDHWTLGSGWDATLLTGFAGYSLNPAAGVTNLFFAPSPAIANGPGDLRLIDLVFNVSGTGTSTIDLSIPTGNGWYDYPDFSEIAVTTQAGSVNVAAVPLPAAAWLMLSGLAPFGWLIRRNRHA